MVSQIFRTAVSLQISVTPLAKIYSRGRLSLSTRLLIISGAILVSILCITRLDLLLWNSDTQDHG